MRILLAIALPVEVAGYDFKHSCVDVIYTGVGKLNAYRAVRKALRDRHYDVIINAGTCGSRKFPIGTVQYPTILKQGDAFTSNSFKAKTLFTSSSIYKKDITLLTSDNFISCVPSSDGSTALPDTVKDYDLFDMEGYAVASAAEFMPKHCFFIKLVSDNLDGTIVDWEKNTKKLSPILSRAIISFIRTNFIKDYEARRI